MIASPWLKEKTEAPIQYDDAIFIHLRYICYLIIRLLRQLQQPQSVHHLRGGMGEKPQRHSGGGVGWMTGAECAMIMEVKFERAKGQFKQTPKLKG